MLLKNTRRQWLGFIALMALAVAPLASLADARAPHRSQARFEVRFMTDMIDHHAMALTHPELQQLCEEMMAAQSAEIEQMQTWLHDWYGVSHEPEMSSDDQEQLEELASLSGAEFEIEFMRMMIRHHAVAVIRGANCIHRAYHHELKELCHDMVKAQLMEIQTMQGWLCHWYDICHRGHRHGRGKH